MTIASRTVSTAVTLAHDALQLRAQNERLIATVKEQDAEIARNRATIAAQAQRILELEQGVAAANHEAQNNRIGYEEYFNRVVSAFEGHISTDTRPAYHASPAETIVDVNA